MYTRIKQCLFILLTCLTASVNAQQFGGTPSGVKWKQVNTDTVRIIFPEGLDSTALRIASLTHYLQQHYSTSIGSQIRKVNIVLQKDITVSNAFVALGPYRSEFYLMPPQNAFELGAQNWADNLSIHEFRHVQQYSNFRKGLSGAMYFLFGEDGQALANAAAIPDWFFEGDAVYNETLLSKQGRGRLPFFFSGYHSLYNAGKDYNYMKLRNGSLKNYLPDHYQLGYLLVAYGREKYGADIWKKITGDAVAFKPLFYPLQGAVKKYTGISYTQFVQDALHYYQRQWKADTASAIPQWLNTVEKNNVVDYKYPYAAEDGSVIVLKTSYRDVPAFYKLDKNKKETKLAVKDISNDDYFSYNNQLIIYSRYQPDLRWDNRDFSVIKLLNTETGEEKKITSKTKYFSPDISHDSKMIVAIAVKPDQHCDVDVLTNEGVKIKSLFSNSRLVYSYPKFSADDKYVYIIVRNNAGEMSLVEKNIADGSTNTLLPYANRIIGFPVVKGDTLLYSCSDNGHDEIWAYVHAQHRQYRLATYSTGLYQATIGENNQLVSSAFTADGYRLAGFTPQWQPENNKDTLANLFVSKPFNVAANNTLASVGTQPYAVTSYPKLFHPFNFHSWRPSYNDPDFAFTIYGENVLNTLQSQLYYDYNTNENYHKVGYQAIYGGWYVQPVIGVSQIFQRNAVLNSDTGFHWNEFNASAGLQLPLNLSGGKSYRYLTLSGTYNIDNVQWTGVAKKLRNNINFNYIQGSLSYISQVQQAAQNIYPRWAQTLLLQYRSITNKYTANQFLANGSLYFPGLLKSHSFVLNGSYQSRDTMNEYSFTNNFPFSRGYSSYNFPRMWKLGANYHFPLCYPDRGLADVVYFQRIRANAFFDYTSAKSLRSNISYQFKTAGAEIYFDTKWWNQQPVTIGIRYSRLIDNKLVGQQPNQWEIILPVNLLN